MMENIKKQRVGSYAFITAEGHVLLSLLNRGPNRGKWTLIGGGVEFGEDPKDALIREIKEEAGIEIHQVPKLLEVFSHQHTFDEAEHRVDMHFISVVHRIELAKKVESKEDGDGFSSDGTRWFSISELDPKMIHPSVFRVLKLLKLE